MAMGRQKDGQGDLMVSWSEMPRSPGHVFYDRLQSVLIGGGFDAFAEASCRPYYAARMGAPSVPPGRYFRMHLVGYFEEIRGLTSAEVAEGRARAEEQLNRAERLSAEILVHGDAEYPKRVYASNNPVPVLYVRGDPAVWASGCSVAVVGSRKTREPYSSSARKFATTASRQGVVVISGFAIGADSIGHRAAQEARGGTVCVMPCGLDKVFPPENRPLWEELLTYSGAAFVSQFGFGQRASSLQLRKRNKLIVAFAQGIVVVQSAVDGGAMNAYRFGLEQKKPIATSKRTD